MLVIILSFLDVESLVCMHRVWPQISSKVISLQLLSFFQINVRRSLIHGMNTLRSLSFKLYTQITEADVEHLTALSSLQNLSFSCCQGTTDASLERLTALRSTKILSIINCRNLTRASLWHLRDAGLQHLGALRFLLNLSLNACCQITDAAWGT